MDPITLPVEGSKSNAIAPAVGLLIVGLVGGYMIGRGGISSDVVYQSASPMASKSEWKTYTNTQYGFEIQYLGSLEEDRGYIRMQNYVATDDIGGLKPGEYYREIGQSDATCKDYMSEIKVTKVGDTTIYRGYGEEGGDPGGIRFAFCANKGDRWVGATTTEADIDGALANKIFSTFKFTK